MLLESIRSVVHRIPNEILEDMQIESCNRAPKQAPARPEAVRAMTLYGREVKMANRQRIYFGLLDAAYSLDEQAAGRKPELSRLLSGAITLDSLFRRRALDIDLQEAALGLEHSVKTDAWYLDAAGRMRADKLSGAVRRLAERVANGGIVDALHE